MVESFSAVSQSDAQILILGSMPGVASLQASAYYAHPRNAFWPIIIGALTQQATSFDLMVDWPYARRIELAKDHGIALWDVLAQCERAGSLDADIRTASVKTNDIARFVGEYTTLKRVLFNGKAAQKLYQRHVATTMIKVLEMQQRSVEFIGLPSTSPAMASLSLQAKSRLWLPALQCT